MYTLELEEWKYVKRCANALSSKFAEKTTKDALIRPLGDTRKKLHCHPIPRRYFQILDEVGANCISYKPEPTFKELLDMLSKEMDKCSDRERLVSQPAFKEFLESNAPTLYKIILDSILSARHGDKFVVKKKQGVHHRRLFQDVCHEQRANVTQILENLWQSTFTE
ncbi:hypothetical protein ACROYT_G014307 [Oculina patagonica]